MCILEECKHYCFKKSSELIKLTEWSYASSDKILIESSSSSSSWWSSLSLAVPGWKVTERRFKIESAQPGVEVPESEVEVQVPPVIDVFVADVLVERGVHGVRVPARGTSSCQDDPGQILISPQNKSISRHETNPGDKFTCSLSSASSCRCPCRWEWCRPAGININLVEN